MRRLVWQEDAPLDVLICDRCGGTIVRPASGLHSVRDDGSELRIYLCGCGARRVILWTPENNR